MFRRNKEKRAIVLGCGPAGLFAAHGLIEQGWKVQIFSNAMKSNLYGAQYLHRPIPDLTDPDTVRVIDYKLIGTIEGYRQKVYGEEAVTTSPEGLEPSHPAWDIRQTYDTAWFRYSHLVNNVTLRAESVLAALEARETGLVLNSVPLDRLCGDRENHEFKSTQIWALGDAPDRGQLAPYRPDDFTVECNGSPDTAWYRSSNVFGHVTMEWPGAKRPPIPAVASVRKPIKHNCDCFDNPKFVSVGRYGTWTKGVLSHEAYETAVSL